MNVPDTSPSLVFAESEVLQEAAYSYQPDRSEEQESDDRVSRVELPMAVSVTRRVLSGNTHLVSGRSEVYAYSCADEEE
jgi:hypothetical protein